MWETMCNGSEKDGKWVALQRETGHSDARGALRAGIPGLSVSHEIACLLRVPHLVISGSASTVRKLSARSAERQVHGGSRMQIYEHTTSSAPFLKAV